MAITEKMLKRLLAEIKAGPVYVPLCGSAGNPHLVGSGTKRCLRCGIIFDGRRDG